MNKTFIIHVVLEAVILGVVTVVVFKKIGTLQKEVDSLKAIVAQQGEQCKQCFAHIKQLYEHIDTLMQQSQAPPSRRHAASFRDRERNRSRDSPLFYPQPAPSIIPSSILSHAQNLQQTMQQTMQQAMQQQSNTQQPKEPDVLFSILNMVPAMMAPNPAATIISQLETQEPKPSVEVINEEDDPDIQEALNEISTPKQHHTVPTTPSISAPVFQALADEDVKELTL